MKQGNVKIFKDKNKLYHLLNFRAFGYSETSLAILFNCHWTSIDYLLKKYRVPEPLEIFSIERIIDQGLPKNDPRWKTVNGTRYNLGRDYKDYLILIAKSQ